MPCDTYTETDVHSLLDDAIDHARNGFNFYPWIDEIEKILGNIAQRHLPGKKKTGQPEADRLLQEYQKLTDDELRELRF